MNFQISTLLNEIFIIVRHVALLIYSDKRLSSIYTEDNIQLHWYMFPSNPWIINGEKGLIWEDVFFSSFFSTRWYISILLVPAQLKRWMMD